MKIQSALRAAYEQTNYCITFYEQFYNLYPSKQLVILTFIIRLFKKSPFHKKGKRYFLFKKNYMNN